VSLLLKLVINLIGSRAGQIAPLLSGYLDHSVVVDEPLADITIDTDSDFLLDGTKYELARDLALWVTMVVDRKNLS